MEALFLGQRCLSSLQQIQEGLSHAGISSVQKFNYIYIVLNPLRQCMTPSSYSKLRCVCVRVCITGGHRNCINLHPNAAACLDDGNCGPKKGRPVSLQP